MKFLELADNLFKERDVAFLFLKHHKIEYLFYVLNNYYYIDANHTGYEGNLSSQDFITTRNSIFSLIYKYLA